MLFYRRRVFPALAETLWLIFLFLDLTRMADSTPVKYAAICLCCVTALLGADTADAKLTAAALCFAVGADWFLLVRDDHYLAGVGLFLVVQGLYALRIYYLHSGRPFLPGLALRAALLLLFAAGWAMKPTLLSLWVVLLYFFNLYISTAEAFSLGKSCRRFAWGLLLLLCCDLCVGAWNISSFLPHALAEFARVGMWLFYLPSQVLVVLSAQRKGETS